MITNLPGLSIADLTEIPKVPNDRKNIRFQPNITTIVKWIGVARSKCYHWRDRYGHPHQAENTVEP